MAVADYFTGFAPLAGTEPKSAALGQVEHESYARIARDVKIAIHDLRHDVDDAIQRTGSMFTQDPDMVDAVPIGVAMVDGSIDITSATNTVILKGNFLAEEGGTAPVAGEVIIGTGTSAVTYTARTPGNGNNDYPNGNRILIFHSDPGALGAPLGARTAVVELEGRNYRCIVIDLATDGAGVITTIASDIASLADADLTDYIKVTAVGIGLVAATATAVQLEDAEGGLYGAFISDDAGAWEWKPVVTWTDTAVTLEDIDGTSGYVADDTINIMLLTNGIASFASVGMPPSAHLVGSASHTADTLAHFNTKISDATLDDSSASRTPLAHDLGGALHTADTLADFNTKISDDNVVGTTSIAAYASGLSPLQWYRAVVDYSDYTAVAQTEALDIGALPANTAFPANVRVYESHIQLVTEFTGPTAVIIAVDLSLGDAGAGTELMTATNVFTGAGLGVHTNDGAYVMGTFEALYVPLLTVDVGVGKITTGLETGNVIVNIPYRALPTV